MECFLIFLAGVFVIGLAVIDWHICAILKQLKNREGQR